MSDRLEVIERYGLTNDELMPDPAVFNCPNCQQPWHYDVETEKCTGHGGELCPHCVRKCDDCLEIFCAACLPDGKNCAECLKWRAEEAEIASLEAALRLTEQARIEVLEASLSCGGPLGRAHWAEGRRNVERIQKFLQLRLDQLMCAPCPNCGEHAPTRDIEDRDHARLTVCGKCHPRR